MPATYSIAIVQSGGIPVILPPDDRMPDVIHALDGLVISGGPDIDPSMYGAELDPNTLDTYPLQDQREKMLIEAAIETDLPILGICRGMQMMCVVEGVTCINIYPTPVAMNHMARGMGEFLTITLNWSLGLLSTRNWDPKFQ